MVYENLDKVVEYLRGLGWTIDTRYNNHGHFSVIEYPEKRMIYEPHPLMSPLFRGQSKLYDECLSNLYRGAFDAVKHFVERLRIVDFEKSSYTARRYSSWVVCTLHRFCTTL